MHSSTSNKNPLIIEFFRKCVVEYANYYPYHKKLGKTYAYLFGNEYLFKSAIFLSETVPIWVMDKYSKIPGLANKKMRQQVKLASTVS